MDDAGLPEVPAGRALPLPGRFLGDFKDGLNSMGPAGRPGVPRANRAHLRWAFAPRAIGMWFSAVAWGAVDDSSSSSSSLREFVLCQIHDVLRRGRVRGYTLEPRCR